VEEMSEIDYKSIAKENHRKCTDAYVEILKLEKRIEKLSLENDVLKMDYETLKESYSNSEMNLQHVTEELEQQQQKWIPVSERLPGNPNPEDGEPKAYLVTINKFAIVPTTLYYMGDGRWVREWDEPSEIYTNILAWRELPERYKEDSHE
jgi:predicted nuclease with TOPRIM domain